MTYCKNRFRYSRFTAAALIFLTAAAPVVQAQEPIKPGFNLFSKEQDIALGQEAAAEIEKEVQVVDDRELTKYVNDIGQRLAAASQDPDYPFTFKVVADPNINAFALPGGPIYVNSGLIAQADNEAQLAGVIGHEIGHVVLRHSTNQASKSSLFQLPALLAAGALDKQGGMLAALGQVGLGLGLNSVLLRYSRKAETQSDIVGARMMHGVGYDPIQAAMFFQKLEEAGGARGPEFLSSHPNPGNRSERIREEIADFSRKNYVTNSRDFAKMKARAAAIKAAEKPAAESGGSAAAAGSGGVPIKGKYSGAGYAFDPPSGWKLHRGEDGVTATVVPENGVIQASGNTAIARGILAGRIDDADGQQQGTSDLIANLEQTNPGLNAVRGQRQAMRIGGRAGESVFLEGQSPLRGQREYVWMVTSHGPDGLFYMLMISPASEYDALAPVFEDAVRSVRFE